jgi:hypothetical protein
MARAVTAGKLKSALQVEGGTGWLYLPRKNCKF